MTIVSVESPYHNEDPELLDRNIKYAIMACRHAIKFHGEAATASHLIYTQRVKDGVHEYVHDKIVSEFDLGRDEVISITNEIREKADKLVFYTDLGMSAGMKWAERIAKEKGIPVEYRKLPEKMLAIVFEKPIEATKRPRSDSE